jgi:hypothetical protein
MLGARIRDWPAMRCRGLDDDLSRDPVPTLEFQKRQIRVVPEQEAFGHYDARISCEDQLRPFVDAGIETWVAPGVSNWSRVYLATQLWIGRADRVDQARQRWFRESALPTAAEVGIPEVGGAQ